jgi:hypothetical protein
MSIEMPMSIARGWIAIAKPEKVGEAGLFPKSVCVVAASSFHCQESRSWEKSHVLSKSVF